MILLENCLEGRSLGPYFFGGVFVLILGSLFVVNRPTIRKLKGALDFMFSYGFDGARTRFIHWKTGRELAFGLEKIGGVKQKFCLPII